MFKFIIQDNQKYLVMRVSKKLYHSRLYPLLQIFCMASLLASFVQLCNFYGMPIKNVLGGVFSSYATYMEDVLSLTFLFYVVEHVFAVQMMKHKLDPVMVGFSFLFPSKMEWYLELGMVLQNKLMLFHITETDTDSFCYYKPIFCFWGKGCYICKNQHTS